MSVKQAKISAWTTEKDYLKAAWSDGETSEWPYVWLRDHSHDPGTINVSTMQRSLFTASLDLDMKPKDVTVTDSELVISWDSASSPTPSKLPLSFLLQYRVPTTPKPRITLPKTLWTATTLGPTPSIPHSEIIASDAGVIKWLQLVARFGFAIATGTPATPEATEALIRKIAYIRDSIFGAFWTFTADASKADTAYTTLELRPHTDGTYTHDAPGMQLLHCLAFIGTGGESTMVDAFAVAERMRREWPEEYRVLSEVEVPGQYIGDGSHLVAARPVFRHARDGELLQVSWNNYDRNAFLLPVKEHVKFYRALKVFDTMANDKTNQWRHVLKPGEAMLFDNWRVLHGREAYEGNRTLCGGYLNHEDFESRLRVAGLI
jgi:trimethyllysine dioxygenase